jgi:hypothetical protein
VRHVVQVRPQGRCTGPALPPPHACRRQTWPNASLPNGPQINQFKPKLCELLEGEDLPVIEQWVEMEDPLDIARLRTAGVAALPQVRWTARSRRGLPELDAYDPDPQYDLSESYEDRVGGRFRVTDALVRKVRNVDKPLTDIEAAKAILSSFLGMLPCPIITASAIRSRPRPGPRPPCAQDA